MAIKVKNSNEIKPSKIKEILTTEYRCIKFNCNRIRFINFY